MTAALLLLLAAPAQVPALDLGEVDRLVALIERLDRRIEALERRVAAQALPPARPQPAARQAPARDPRCLPTCACGCQQGNPCRCLHGIQPGLAAPPVTPTVPPLYLRPPPRTWVEPTTFTVPARPTTLPRFAPVTMPVAPPMSC